MFDVLIIDGDPGRSDALGPTLERDGFNVTYTTVQDAVLDLYRSDFDLIVGSDRADTALDHFRSNPAFDGTPFLMASERAHSDIIVDRLNRGADDYILLGQSPKETVSRIRGHLQRSSAASARLTIDPKTFESELARELDRLRLDGGGSRNTLLAIVEVTGMTSDEPEILHAARNEASSIVATHLGPLDLVGTTRQGDLAILLPATSIERGVRTLTSIMVAGCELATGRLPPLGYPLHIGFVALGDDAAMSPSTAVTRASIAATKGIEANARDPQRFTVRRRNRRTVTTPDPTAISDTGRVLVVDDDRFTIALVSSVLGRRGIDVVTASGSDAVHALYRSRYDMIVVNGSMPDVSGLDLLERVRSDPAFDSTPFMIMSASSDPEMIVEALAAGADDYLVKSSGGDAFFARLQTRLIRAQSQRRAISGAMVEDAVFEFQLGRELLRAELGGAGGVVAMLEVPTLDTIDLQVGPRRRREILDLLAERMQAAAGPLDVVGATRSGDLAILMPETTDDDGATRLYRMAEQAAGLADDVNGQRIRLVPMIGYTTYARNTVTDPDTMIIQATVAAAEAAELQDLQPHPYRRDDSNDAASKPTPKWMDWVQVFLTSIVGIVAPFFIYMGLDHIGIDVTWFVYLGVVAALVFTATLIWIEGFMADSHSGPPSQPGAPAPPASAIICAYLPNEAATIFETLDRFLEVEYEAGFQIILAYNTPTPMEIEGDLRRLEAENDRLLVIEVPYSTSKAQNLNAALARVTGDFVGVFDADHHPEPTAFTRAWLWLSNGYDAVQGHCLVRNADENFLARMISVEFESIYAVSHPGRYIRDQFGIFGGSNGYWWTDQLHIIRMRGSMLTEDIDSSMRLLESGGKIASDPGLISRELATTTAKQVWNQRLRWAQGWFQVSLRHVFTMLRSPKFTLRQKFGIFNLLLQREVYPWITLQMIPLVAFWFWRGDGFDWFVPIFVFTTIFTSSVGFGQVIFAYRNAHPDIKQHKWWFVQYLLFALLFYTEAKNIIARVAQIKQFMGESSWRVTPRSS